MKKLICLLSVLLFNLFVHNGFAETKYRVTSLGFMSDYHKAYAYSINNQNEITGFDCDEAGLPRAYKYSDGLMMDIGAPSGTNSRGLTINNSGAIGGVVWSSSSHFESAYIYENGNINTIGDLSNHENVSINAINDNGVVVGSRRVINGRDNAFMYKDGS